LTITKRSNIAIHIILWAIPPSMGFWALWLGQDASWDLRNYHFYNAFAYLTHRMGHDVAAAQVATYYNPWMHLPFYYAVTTLPPKAVGFVLGLIPGFNVFLLYAIAGRLIDLKDPIKTGWFCLGTAILGLLGAAGISELGTSFGDNALSLMVLGALWLIIRHRKRFIGPGFCGFAVAMAAGLLAGAACGLKQPFGVYAVGLCAAFFGLSLPFRRRFSLALVFGLGVLAGTAMTGGFWMVEMWKRFENPLFPYFNQVFQSPWGAPESYRDARFIPKGLLMWLAFPIWFTLNPLQVGEVPFRDLRLPVLYLLLIACLVKAILGRRKPDPVNSPGPNVSDRLTSGRFVVIFFFVSFVVWIKLFSVYRYLVVCELLAPLAIFLVLGYLVRDLRRRVRIAVGCFVLILVTLHPGDWDRRPWAADYFGIKAPRIAEPADTLVLVTGYEPMAYMIPFFPPQVRFLRIHSYLTGPSSNANRTDRLMRDIIADHGGPIFLIHRSFEEGVAIETLKTLGLEFEKTGCQELVSHVEPLQNEPFYFCPVKKTTTL
jgi:hypothetical protein